MTDKKLEEVRAILANEEEVDLPEDMQPAESDDDPESEEDDTELEGDEAPIDDRGDPGYAPDPGYPSDHARDRGDPRGEFDDAPDDEITLDQLREGAEYPLNDYGNGLRFVLYMGRDCIWIPRVGWYVWQGNVWRKDDNGIAVRGRAHRLGQLIEQEATAIVLGGEAMTEIGRERGLKSELVKLQRDAVGADLDERESILAEIRKFEDQISAIGSLKRTLGTKRARHRKFAVTSGNKGKIDAMINEAGIMLSHELDELDAKDYDLNTESGVLRFEVVKAEGMSSVAHVRLIPHAREQLNTKLMPVKYDPGARSELFDKFITRIQPSITMREFLQRWFGYSFTGDTGEQKLAFFHGMGGNGKSVLVDLMARLAGNYSATAKIESLVGQNRRSAGDATPDLVPLMGARFVRASEPEEGEKLQEAKIKELTGGEPLLVRALQEDFVAVQPKFKITIQGNHKPVIRGTDNGIWRRLLLVPFSVAIPDDEKDLKIGEKLFAESERPALLNWIIDGLLAYLEGGLREPEEVIAATAAFREESDPVAAFLTECAVVTGDPADFMKAVELKDSFQFWQKSKAEGAWGDRTVANKMKAKAGNWRHPTSGQMFSEAKRNDWGYRGIKLTDTFRAVFDKRPHASSSSSSPGPDDQSWRDRSGVPDDYR